MILFPAVLVNMALKLLDMDSVVLKQRYSNAEPMVITCLINQLPKESHFYINIIIMTIRFEIMLTENVHHYFKCRVYQVCEEFDLSKKSTNLCQDVYFIN